MRRHRAVPRSWLEIRFARKLPAPSGRCCAWLGEHQGEVVPGAMFLSAGSSFELLYAGSDRAPASFESGSPAGRQDRGEVVEQP